MSFTTADFPVVLSGQLIRKNPGNALLAEKLGLFEPVESGSLFDVAVVGAGPAGRRRARICGGQEVEPL
jgi:thioredoxin reductase (NADPH)